MSPAKFGILKLVELSKGLPGITPDFGSTLAEAGAVCFEGQNHPNGVELKLTGYFKLGIRYFGSK